MRLTKVQLSTFFNVSDITIYLWEHNRVQPSLVHIPKIIELLGRDPYEKKPKDLGDKIREYRRVHGLTKKKLAEQLGIDLSTLAGWENGEHQPTKKLLDKMAGFNLFQTRI